MSLQPVVKRRLSFEGCRKVGNQLAQLVQARQSTQPPLMPLPVDFLAECQETQAKTTAFDAIQDREAPMGYVDNATDQCLGGLYNQLLRKERCFTYEQILALTPEEEEHLERCRQLRLRLFPDGIDFVREPFHVEWNRLYELQKRLEDTSIQEELKYLSMTIEAARLVRWIDHYGARLGITQPSQGATDPKSIAVSAWHEAWENLVVEGRHSLRKSQDAELKKFITDALSLFDRQLSLEVEIDRQRRIRQEESNQPAEEAIL